MTEAHHYLGLCHLRRGRYAEAVVAFTEVVRLDPSFVEAREALELARREAAAVPTPPADSVPPVPDR
jgi:cytochrome c-type biogenesis protein CcmH/NrfG